MEEQDVDEALQRARQTIQEQQQTSYAYTRHLCKRQRRRGPLNAAAEAEVREAEVREAEEELGRAADATDSPERQPQHAGPTPQEQQQQQDDDSAVHQASTAWSQGAF